MNELLIILIEMNVKTNSLVNWLIINYFDLNWMLKESID